jgi:hypothetical protein
MQGAKGDRSTLAEALLLIRIEITRRLREVGEITGVRVLDRIIIGKGCYVSFAD